MRSFGRLALAVLLVLAFASPCLARMATIDATVPLQDHSEQSVQAALVAAVESAVHRAVAMGFSWVAISEALVLEDSVNVQILAADADPEGDEDAGSGGALGGGPDQPARLDL